MIYVCKRQQYPWLMSMNSIEYQSGTIQLRHTCWCVPDGVVATMVTKLQLESCAPKGLSQQLVAHADAKHWFLTQNPLCVLHCIWHS